MTYLTITHGRATFKIKPENLAKFKLAFDKANKKPRKSSIKSESRSYPEFKAGMTTEEYVKIYQAYGRFKNLYPFEFEPLPDTPSPMLLELDGIESPL